MAFISFKPQKEPLRPFAVRSFSSATCVLLLTGQIRAKRMLEGTGFLPSSLQPKHINGESPSLVFSTGCVMDRKQVTNYFCRFLLCVLLICFLFAAKSSADNIESVSGNVQLADFQPGHLSFCFLLDTTNSTVLPGGNVITLDGLQFKYDHAVSYANLFDWTGPDGSMLQIGDYDYFAAIDPKAAAAFPSPGSYPALAVYMNCGTLSYSTCRGPGWASSGSVEIAPVADGDPQAVLLLGICLPFLVFLPYRLRRQGQSVN
jgi:hypothetical protein